MNLKRSRGVSLVEILVALAVGLFLTAGIIQLFVSSKQAYRSEEGFARLQEAGRFALDTIARDLRAHGNLGCTSVARLERDSTFEQQTTTDGTTTSTETYWGAFNVLAEDLIETSGSVETVLVGAKRPIGYRQELDSAGAGSLVNPSSVSAGITWKSSTDALVVAGVFQKGVYVGADMEEWDDDLEVQSGAYAAPGELMVVADCANADIFAVTAVTGSGASTVLAHGTSGSVNRSEKLSTLYKKDSDAAINAMVYPFSFKTYFIGTDADSVPALYVSYFGVASGKPDRQVQELVENVEDMIVTFYGHDDNNDGVADGYQRSDEVTDWDEVVSARIELLVRSPEKILTAAKTEPFDGGDYTDRHQREVFTTTVALRSRSEWRMQ